LAYKSDNTVAGIKDDGVEALFGHPAFMEGAIALHNGERPLIQPNIMLANLLLPGETQRCHTDVPEFRGVNRTNTPEWLLVCMLHSGMFKEYHVPIATAVIWFSSHSGGQLCVYDKPFDAPAIQVPSPPNKAILLDTDKIYHGVDPVGGIELSPPVLPPNASLLHKVCAHSLRSNDAFGS
jgi:hypothetical protein